MEKYTKLCNDFNLILYRKKGPVDTLDNNMANVIIILNSKINNTLKMPLKDAILENRKPSRIMDSIKAIKDVLDEQRKIIKKFREDDILFKDRFRVLAGELRKKATMITKELGVAELRGLAASLANSRAQIDNNSHLIDSKEVDINNQYSIFNQGIYNHLNDLPSMLRDPIKNITSLRNISTAALALNREVARELPLTADDKESYSHVEEAESSLSRIPKMKFA